MKILAIILITILLFSTSCREQKNAEKMIPVESDGGIGDGAENLDSLLKYQTPPIISEKTRDTLLIKRDSL